MRHITNCGGLQRNVDASCMTMITGYEAEISCGSCGLFERQAVPSSLTGPRALRNLPNHRTLSRTGLSNLVEFPFSLGFMWIWFSSIRAQLRYLLQYYLVLL
jgi:hypothetical protein